MEEEPLKLDGVQLRSAAAPQSTHAGLEEEAGARLGPARVLPYVPHWMLISTRCLPLTCKCGLLFLLNFFMPQHRE